MLRRILLSAVAVSFVAVPVALAQGETDDDRTVAESAETEEGISLEAFLDGRMERLRAADQAGDGVLSHEELVDYVMQREFERRAQRLARMLDVSGDGVVSLEDLENHYAKVFALLDRDDDGVLSRDELRRMRGMHMHGMQERGPRFAMRRGEHRPGHFRFMRRHKGGAEMRAEEAPAEE